MKANKRVRDLNRVRKGPRHYVRGKDGIVRPTTAEVHHDAPNVFMIRDRVRVR